MRRLLVLIIALVTIPALAPAAATEISEGHAFSGIETMTFQNGSFPTPDYEGIRLFGISSDSTAVTKGDMSWTGDSLVWIGDVNNLGGEDRLLFSIDISALPDSCVIVDATLYVLKLNSTFATTEYPHVGVHRLFRPFDNTATWTNRKTVPADTAWSPAGAIMSSSRAMWPNLYGASEYYMAAPRIEYQSTATSIPTYAGLPIACGADSIWSGYSQSIQRDALICSDATSAGRWHLAGGTDIWVPMDITHLVRMWHQSIWANYGAIIALSQADIASELMRDTQFRGYLPATKPGGGASLLVPWVVVHYLHCAW